MAKIEKLKNGLKLICDCGVNHFVSMDAEENLVIKSQFVKQKKENEENGKTEKNNEPESKPRKSFFSIFAD